MSKHIKRAAKNREDLLEAAVEMFKIHGMSVPLQVIIDHAGVGRATFYRNFTDRKALVYALLEQAVSHLELRAEQYRMYDDGLIRLIKSHVHNLNNLSALMEYWRVLDQHDEVLISLIQHHQQIVQPLIDRAIENEFVVLTLILKITVALFPCCRRLFADMMKHKEFDLPVVQSSYYSMAFV